MHVQVITFRLDGFTEADYRRFCDGLAPTIAEQPGLLSTIWLADAETNTYGAVCVWRDGAAMDSFSRSDALHALTNHPNLTHVMLPPRASAPL